MVYLQPLWLEVIDFLWEGVLGAAVWGAAANPEERQAQSGMGNGNSSSEEMDNNHAERAGTSANQEQDNHSDTEKSRASDQGGRGSLRSSSEIHVKLMTPTVILPGALVDERHLALRPAQLRFSTWTGGPADRCESFRIIRCTCDLKISPIPVGHIYGVQ